MSGTAGARSEQRRNELEVQRDTLESQRALLQQANAQLEFQRDTLATQHSLLKAAHDETAKREQQYQSARSAAILEIQALQQTAEADRSRRLQFVRDILHDIRTPIASLGGSIANFRLAKARGSDDLAAQAVNHLLRAYTTVSKLSDELFALSSYELKRQATDLRAIEVGEVIQNVAVSFHEAATEKGLELRIYQSNRKLYCLSDSNALHRVLVNLISNAVKFTKPRSRGTSGIVVGAVGRGLNSIDIVVADTGVGIDEARLASVWEYGETTNGTGNEKGYGIGLPLIRAVCSSLPEHDLKLESNPGKGSRFTLRIPIAAQEEMPDRHSSPRDLSSEVSIEGHNLLLVDDQEDILAQEALLLKLLGAMPLEADSVANSLDVVSPSGVDLDLIVTDFHLRVGEKGSDVVEAVRERSNREIPAIIVTADSSTLPIDAAKRLGCAEVVRKPLSVEKLLDALGRLRRLS